MSTDGLCPAGVSERVGKLVISRKAKRRPAKSKFGGMVIRCTGWVRMSPEEAEREKWRPPNSKLVAIKELGKPVTIRCHSHTACREILNLLRGHFVLDVLSKV
jgi:hypothetical protein